MVRIWAGILLALALVGVCGWMWAIAWAQLTRQYLVPTNFESYAPCELLHLGQSDASGEHADVGAIRNRHVLARQGKLGGDVLIRGHHLLSRNVLLSLNSSVGYAFRST